MTSVSDDLVRLLGRQALREGFQAEPYLKDSTEMQGLRGRADAVVVPADVNAVQEVVRWCYQRGIPIVPRGGGTGFAGGAVPIDGGVVCSLERLKAIRHFDPEFWRAEVEAGVTTSRVHKLARENGLMFPPDPGASEQSQIGGNISCNAGGPHSFKYGVTRGWITGIEAVVAEGDLIRLGGPLRKDVAGYDLISLFVGSEGTLGVIVSAWLKLIPAPEAVNLVLAGYPSLEAGIASLLRVYSSGLVPATLEFFDRGCLAACRPSFPGVLPDSASFLLISEVDGTAREIGVLAEELTQTLATDAVLVRTVTTQHDSSELTRWRNGVSFAVSAQRGGKMSEDVAVPIDKLATAITGIAQIAERFGLEGCSWGHAGDGNAHATFMIDASSPDEVTAATQAIQELFALVLSLGGSVSGEHGLGWVKREQFDRQFGQVEGTLQRVIKKAFDPANLFNPGKKLPPTLFSG